MFQVIYTWTRGDYVKCLNTFDRRIFLKKEIRNQKMEKKNSYPMFVLNLFATIQFIQKIFYKIFNTIFA